MRRLPLFTRSALPASPFTHPGPRTSSNQGTPAPRQLPGTLFAGNPRRTHPAPIGHGITRSPTAQPSQATARWRSTWLAASSEPLASLAPHPELSCVIRPGFRRQIPHDLPVTDRGRSLWPRNSMITEAKHAHRRFFFRDHERGRSGLFAAGLLFTTGYLRPVRHRARDGRCAFTKVVDRKRLKGPPALGLATHMRTLT